MLLVQISYLKELLAKRSDMKDPYTFLAKFLFVCNINWDLNLNTILGLGANTLP